MIHEEIIHFIWKHQAFNHRNLTTENGESIQIIDPGEINHNAGPDFLNATLRIDGLAWNGSVEIHVNASDWHSHNHSDDPAYTNVVLHVVWINNSEVSRDDGSVIPVLVMADRTNPKLVHTYSRIATNLSAIPCSSQEISLNAFRSALEKSLDDRLMLKSQEIFRIWHRSGMDWEQTSFIWLCRHFGFKVNNEVFQVLGESLSWKILQKHSDRLDQVEALLFGMAGLLESSVDEYQSVLAREFSFLRHKYGLKPRIKAHEWRFHRLRPANFPTIRLAQLSAMIATTSGLFNWLMFTNGQPRKIEVSRYWETHYYFGKTSGASTRRLGELSWQHLRMNVVAPLQYALALKNGSSTQRIAKLFGQIKPEDNRVTRLWESIGVNMKSSLDSQSYYALYQQGCKLHKCLHCPVGIDLLRSA